MTFYCHVVNLLFQNVAVARVSTVNQTRMNTTTIVKVILNCRFHDALSVVVFEIISSFSQSIFTAMSRPVFANTDEREWNWNVSSTTTSTSDCCFQSVAVVTAITVPQGQMTTSCVQIWARTFHFQPKTLGLFWLTLIKEHKKMLFALIKKVSFTHL